MAGKLDFHSTNAVSMASITLVISMRQYQSEVGFRHTTAYQVCKLIIGLCGVLSQLWKAGTRTALVVVATVD